MIRKTGTYEQIGAHNFFIPYSLNEINPPLQISSELIELYGQAMLSLGKLNEVAGRLPDPHRFIKAYVIKEALLSSEIEGIHTTLIDVFTIVLDSEEITKETRLVLNYCKALEEALLMMKKQGLPFATRVILHAHKTLMSIGKDDKSDPGNFRKQAVQVGKLIPAPATKIPALMEELESYINGNSIAPLLKAGLVHLQFETIHPFLDGNGRIGRLLIVLMLIQDGLIEEPVLYPSYYFKKHQLEYYERLDAVRTSGDFEGWLAYYLKGIAESSDDAYQRAYAIELLEKQILEKIKLGKKTNKDQLIKALTILFRVPIITIGQLAELLDKSYNTARVIVDYFVSISVLEEISIQKRNKTYCFNEYLALLEKEFPL